MGFEVQESSPILIQDLSASSEALSFMKRLRKGETERVLEEGQVISFASVLDYEVASFDEMGICLKLVRDLKAGFKSDADPEYFSLFGSREEICIGRDKKKCQFVIHPAYKCVSSKHAAFSKDGFKDHSTHGTFVYFKTIYEQRNHHQSRIIEYDDQELKFSDISLTIE